MRRFFSGIIVLWGVCTITFFLLHLTPGDPVENILGQQASLSNESGALRHELGLDLPLSKQYVVFFDKLLHGNLGTSYFSRRPVTEEISDYLGPTLLLAMSSMIFAMLLGIPMGIYAAIKQRKTFDHFADGFSLLAMSLPSFLLAPLLILAFSIKMDWLPINEQDGFKSLILPTVSLGLGLSAVIIRITRASFLNIMNDEYVTVARAKGLSEFTIFSKHIFKNALTPILTMLSLQFGAVLTGVVITETIFDWPGLGILLYTSLQSRDYPTVQGCVLIIALIYFLVNLATDIGYTIINPRLKTASA